MAQEQSLLCLKQDNAAFLKSMAKQTDRMLELLCLRSLIRVCPVYAQEYLRSQLASKHRTQCKGLDLVSLAGRET